MNNQKKIVDPIERGEDGIEDDFIDSNLMEREEMKRNERFQQDPRGKENKSTKTTLEGIIGFKSLNVVEKEKEQVEIPLPSWVKDQKKIEEESIDIHHLSSLLNPVLLKNIEENLHFKEFFPVQSKLIPLLVQSRPFGGDICICAPTGSGKTITYVIPIVQSLMNRVIIRLRALIVVPTQNLVNQVTDVFESVAHGTGLKIGSLGGDDDSFINQQKHIVHPMPDGVESQSARCEGYSKIDILVATPNHLVQHLDKTPQFSLEHLQFLIVDEADRMLTKVASQSDWVNRVVKASHTASNQTHLETNLLDMKVSTVRSFMKPRFDPRDEPLFKLLFSATLSGNLPALNNLRLVNPQFYAATLDPTHFRLPSTLKQYIVECDMSEKPLVLIHLLLNIKLDRVLCFLPGAIPTHRLYLLLRQFLGKGVAEFSDKTPSSERKAVLTDFVKGSIKIIVCSDLMSRGLDIPDVLNVINYSLPSHITTFVHRCGRTARAGKSGTSWTFLKRGKKKSFLESLHHVENSQPETFDFDAKSNLEPFQEKFQEALLWLKNEEFKEKQEKKEMREKMKLLEKRKEEMEFAAPSFSKKKRSIKEYS